MTSFDEMIGAEPEGPERERLRNVHELLLEAGPPPELAPELRAGPTLAMTMGRAARVRKSKRFVIPAIAAAVLLAAVIAIGADLHGNGSHYPSLSLHATGFAPSASGKLEILPAKHGTQPMKLEVSGLPRFKDPYVVYLVRDGRPVAPCGHFIVSNGDQKLTVALHSPYKLQGTDQWVVTEPSHIADTPGATVLTTVT